MIQLGKKQTLKIVRRKDFGVYVGNEEESVLLPGKYVPEYAELGDEVEVFVYRDSKDRLVATTQTPKISLDEVAVLEVKDTGKIGAFLDWGLEKDLFLIRDPSVSSDYGIIISCLDLFLLRIWYPR